MTVRDGGAMQAPSARAWSRYQEAVFDAVSAGAGHLVVEALAGSGKTTTILEAVRRVERGRDVLLCAFNVRIKQELERRAPPGVEVATLHSLGFRAVRAAWGARLRVDGGKERRLLERAAPWARGDARQLILRTVALAKNALAPAEPGALHALMLGCWEARALGDGALSDCVDAAAEVLAASAVPAPEISFDDMVWLPARYGWKTPRRGLVLVDEAQDLCAAQREIVLGAAEGTGRVVAVGDRRQAIYGFRGADEDSIPRLVRELPAAVLPLSICYRCPEAVLELAREVVPQIEAAPGAPRGEVQQLPEGAADAAEPGDAILSRTNAPLMGLCLSFLRRGVPAAISGRDVGRKLLGLVRRAAEAAGPAAGPAEVGASIVEWADRQADRLYARGEAAGADEVLDMRDTALALLDGCASLADVERRAEDLFGEPEDAGARVLLSTVHKAKGLEWPNVWVLASTFRRHRGGEELNLWYVAITRCRWKLHIVGQALPVAT